MQMCLCCVCRPWQYKRVCIAYADPDDNSVSVLCVQTFTSVSVLCVQTLTIQACLCSVCRPWQYKHVCVVCADLDNTSMSVLCVQTLTIQACVCYVCRPWQYKHVCVVCADLYNTSMSVLCVQTLTVQACLCCVCRPWQYKHVCVVCADQDECEDGKCEGECENSLGSFKCICFTGFTEHFGQCIGEQTAWHLALVVFQEQVLKLAVLFILFCWNPRLDWGLQNKNEKGLQEGSLALF